MSVRCCVHGTQPDVLQDTGRACTLCSIRELSQITTEGKGFFSTTGGVFHFGTFFVVSTIMRRELLSPVFVSSRCIAMLGVQRRFLDRYTVRVPCGGKAALLAPRLGRRTCLFCGQGCGVKGVGLVGVRGIDAKQKSCQHPRRAGGTVFVCCAENILGVVRCVFVWIWGGSLPSAVPVATASRRNELCGDGSQKRGERGEDEVA